MDVRQFYTLLFVTFLVLNSTEECKFGSGPECIFPCHCNGDAECDADTGECPTGCDDGDPNGHEWRGAFFGPGCQIGNVAHGRPATQVSYQVNYPASNAVDGNIDPHVANGHCAEAQSQSIQPGAWWEVYLGDTYVIQGVALYNNDDTYDRKRIRYIIVEVQNEDVGVTHCFDWDNSYPPVANKTCSEPLLGDRVHIRRRAPNAYEPNWITLCEVMVYGYLYLRCGEGRYGPGCLLECGNCICGITGDCPDGCSAGWVNEDCRTPCDDGSWGDQCSSNCNCRDSNEVCGKVAGECSESGCAEMFVGTGCNHELPTVTVDDVSIRVITATTIELRISSQVSGGSFSLQPTSLQVEQRMGMNDDWTLAKEVNYDGGTKTITINDLQPGTNYEFQAKLVVTLGDERYTTDPVDLGSYQTLCADLFWGDNCEPCHCEDVMEVCDRLEGTCPLSGCSGAYFGHDCELERPLITRQLEATDWTSSSVTLLIPAYDQGEPPTYYRIESKKDDQDWLDVGRVEETGDDQYTITIDDMLESNAAYRFRAVPVVEWNGQTLESRPSPVLDASHSENQFPLIAVIVGVVSGVIVFVVVLIIIIIVRYKKKKVNESKLPQNQKVDSGYENPTAEYEIVEDFQRQRHGKEQLDVSKQDGRRVEVSLPSRLTPESEPTREQRLQGNDVMGNPITLMNLASHIDNLKRIPDGFLNEYKLIPNGLLGTIEAAMRPESEGKDRFPHISAYDHSRIVLEEREANQDYINANIIKGIRESSKSEEGLPEVDDEHFYERIGPTAEQNITEYYNMRQLPQRDNGGLHNLTIADASTGGRETGNEKAIYENTDIDHARRTVHGIESFIAAQGPVSSTMRDFLQMVWQEDANRIVMVTKLSESGKVHCEQYWPEQGTLEVDEFKIFLLNEEVSDDYIIRELCMRNGDVTRVVRQFNFLAWPEGGVPNSATSLIDFRNKVRAFDERATGPMVVHCSAGVGRTGVFIALDCLLDQASKEGLVDVLRWTMTMRQQRLKMIQTLDQYIFLYDALLEANISTNTTFSCADVVDTVARLRQQGTARGKTGIEEQFETLVSLRTPLVEETDLAARRPENHSKNRSPDIVPRDDRRPRLMTPVDVTSDYINAVYIDGYKQDHAYLLTQMTLENTVCDIWRLIWDHKVHSVIVLNETKLTEKPEEIYWPVDVKDIKKFGPLSVKLVKCEVCPNFTLRELKVSKSTTHLVRQYVINCADDLPPIGNMLEVIEKAGRWQQQNGNGPITIQCLDGVRLSGVYCAATYILEKMKIDQEVDIFHAVKQIRTGCPHLIQNIEQYNYLHEVVLAYMKHNASYYNLQ